MQLVERHIIVDTKPFEQICFNSARLYNFINYHKRQALFGYQEDFSENEVSGLCAEYNQEDYRRLPAQTAQQVIKQVFDAWRSHWAALKERKRTPSKFMAKPKPPKYKDKQGYNVATFPQNCSLKSGFMHFPKATKLPPIKTKVDNVCQVRIIPQATCFVIEIVYEKKEVMHENVKEGNALSIDLGLKNLITAIDNVGNRPFIINGGRTKSINAYFNKKKALLASYVGSRGTSNRIVGLTLKRSNKIENEMHQTSAFILKYCLANNIGTVVIGKNEHWKSKINLGKQTNQNFVSIPHAKLIDKIAYKLQLNGIKLIIQEESYTSKCDHLALEPIEKHEVYLGKRVGRGLFLSSTGKVLNADVNGAIGIMLKSKVIRECERFIRSITDTGIAFMPHKVKFMESFFLSPK